MISELRQRSRAVVASGLLALGLVGCGSPGEPPRRSSGSALLVDPSLGSLTGSELARLKAQGVGEIFLEAVRIDRDGLLTSTAGLDSLNLPPGAEVTLVLRGELPDEPEPLARLVAEMRWKIEDQGLLPRGLHLAGPLEEDLRRAGARAQALRAALPPFTPVSGSVPLPRLDDPDLESWTDELDFLTVRLYGQLPGTDDDPKAWSFDEVRRHAERVDALGRPWMLEAVTLGRVLRLGRGGAIVDEKLEASATELFGHRDLELRAGFSLDGSNRRTYTLEARREVAAAGWELAPGDALRIVLPSTADLEGLLRLLGAMVLDHHLGQLYHRLPAPSEALSLSAGNLANALTPEPATPDLHATATLQQQSPGTWHFRFTLENRNDEPTELSLIENNFLEIHSESGTFGKVDAGDFHRYDLFRVQEDAVERTFREANRIRLHQPFLAGRQAVSTRDVQILGSAEPTLKITGRFLLPDGRTVEVEGARWQDGALIEPRSVGAAQPSPSGDPAAVPSDERGAIRSPGREEEEGNPGD